MVHSLETGFSRSLFVVPAVMPRKTVKATIPLVAWSIRQPDILEPPAARALASSLPYGSEKLEESMVSERRIPRER